MSTLPDSASFEKFLTQFTKRFTPELAEHFATLPFDPEFQARLDELGEKANDIASAQSRAGKAIGADLTGPGWQPTTGGKSAHSVVCPPASS